MYCKNCGEEIRDDAVICIHCGTQVKKLSTHDGTNQTSLGILLALFLGIIGLIIGLCIYPAGSIERKTFMRAWGNTFGIIVLLAIIIVFASTCAFLTSY